MDGLSGRLGAPQELAEAFDAGGDGGQDVLQVGLGLAPVAAVADAVAAGELADGALDAGPHRVALVPGAVVLAGAVAGLQFAELARGKPTVRWPSPEVVQAARTGQGWHWPLVKRATMSGGAAPTNWPRHPGEPLARTKPPGWPNWCSRSWRRRCSPACSPRTPPSASARSLTPGSPARSGSA